MSDIKACQQAGCDIKTDGKCLEGLEPQECPHFYWAEIDEDANVESDNPSVITTVSNKKALFRGSELGLNEISMITNRYQCDLVVILGDLDCGKTTLLATIFDLFQVGKLKNYLFAGSLTQKGFEIRSHLSRIASGAIKADTERTKFLEFRLLHIAIKSDGTSLLKHFLLSDISGETIQLARSSSSTMKEQLGMVKLADHIIYIIDGEKLASGEKIPTIMDAELFIQSALDNKIFSKETTLNILISKWDLLKNAENFNLEDMVVKKINDRFSQSLKAIIFRKIASRPDNDNELDLGYGVEELISDFMRVPEPQKRLTIQPRISNRLIENYKIQLNG